MNLQLIKLLLGQCVVIEKSPLGPLPRPIKLLWRYSGHIIWLYLASFIWLPYSCHEILSFYK